MEWASFPVLVGTKGQKRTVKRGQSYYAGDGLNKALVAPDAVEAILDRVKAAGSAVPAPQSPPAEVAPRGDTSSIAAPAPRNGLWASIISIILKLFGKGA